MAPLFERLGLVFVVVLDHVDQLCGFSLFLFFLFFKGKEKESEGERKDE